MVRRSLISSDIEQFKFVPAPQVSPDGKSVLFVLTQMINDEGNGDYS